MALRRLLLDSATLRQRLQDLANQRLVATATVCRSSRWVLSYFADVERLAEQLEGVWTAGELHRLIAMLAAGRTFDAETIERRIPRTLTIVAGRGGNGKRRTPSTIAFVARSLELKSGGLTATEADERVAHENPCGVSNAQAVAVYRKRVRDQAG